MSGLRERRRAGPAAAFLAAAWGFGLPAGAVAAPAVPAVRVDEILAKLRANLRPLKDLSASVTVEVVAKKVWTEAVYRERYLYAFKAPSLIRLDYLEPAGGPRGPTVKIARGRTVWIDGVRVQGGQESQEASSPLSLWSLSLNPDALRKAYSISGFLEPSHPNLAGLELVPVGRQATVARIRVWVDRDRGVVVQTKVFGASDDLLSTSGVVSFARIKGVWLPVKVETFGCDGRCKTTVTWAGIRVNAGLSDALFRPVRR